MTPERAYTKINEAIAIVEEVTRHRKEFKSTFLGSIHGCFSSSNAINRLKDMRGLLNVSVNPTLPNPDV